MTFDIRIEGLGAILIGGAVICLLVEAVRYLWGRITA